jgi:20S proteasome subunit beta 6
LQVGDGLEIYVVVAKGRPVHGLEGSNNIQEISSAEDEERVFVIRRELKKD